MLASRLSAMVLVSALTLTGNVGAQPPARESVSIEVGRPFPPLTLPLLKDGSPASIADFRGEKIIMHVFASW